MTAVFASAAFVAGLVVGWPAPYALAVVGVVAVLLRGERWALMAVLVACAAAGELRGSAVVGGAELEQTLEGPHLGVVLDYPRRSGDSQRFSVRVAGVDVCSTAQAGPLLGRGDLIQFDGSIHPRRDASSGRLAALVQLGCGGTVDATQVRVVKRGDGVRRWIEDARHDLVDWFGSVVPGDDGVLLAGLVVGDDYDLSFDAKQDFLTLGMSHITAVSGSNLALLTWVLLRPGARRRDRWLEVLLLAGLWFYVLLAGAGPATMRAGLTATLAVGAARTGRKPELLSLASLVAAAQVGVQPHLIDNLAYRLSTVAMLVMISTLAGRPGEHVRDRLTSLLMCTTAIQLVALTFTPQRDQAILAGIVANVLAAPLVALAFGAAFAAAIAQVIYPALGEAVATVAALPATLVLALMDRLGGSRLAEVRPTVVEGMPLILVRAVLIAAVVGGFGRHARRGTGDVWRRAERWRAEEKLVWASLGLGGVLGVAGFVVTR